MKIEAGRYYRTRDGQKVGPMVYMNSVGRFYQSGRGGLKDPEWLPDGGHVAGFFKMTAADDLIAEWRDEPDLTAPDYNDGKWHGWNGGECPARGALGHITYADGVQVARGGEVPLDDYDWGQPLMFRVTKPAPPKPREKWITGDNCVWETLDEAMAANHGVPVLYREVLP